MKAPITSLVVAAVAFAGSAVYFWSQLQVERARAAEVDQLTQGLHKRIAELESARGDLESHQIAVATGNLATAPNAAITQSNGAVSSGPAVTVDIQGPRPEPSPAHRKMLRSQIRVNNRRMYSDVGEQLGLNQEEAGKLIDLITDQQVATILRGLASADPETLKQQWQQRQREEQSQIAALIGQAKAEDLRKYQESLPARVEVEAIARQLEESDAPLSENQRKRLVAIVSEERSRVPMPQNTPGADENAFTDVSTRWREDYEQRIGAQARAILNHEQYNAYSEYQQWQAEMREHFRVNRGSMSLRESAAVGVAVPGVTSIAIAAPVSAPVTQPEK